MGPSTSKIPLMFLLGSRIGFMPPNPRPRLLPYDFCALPVLLDPCTDVTRILPGAGSNKSSQGESGPSASAWSQLTTSGEAANGAEQDRGVIGEEPFVVLEAEDVEDVKEFVEKYAASRS